MAPSDLEPDLVARRLGRLGSVRGDQQRRELGLGVALKIDDGAARAADAAIAAVAQALLKTDEPVLQQYSHRVLRNRRDIAVGAMRPGQDLRHAIGAVR